MPSISLSIVFINAFKSKCSSFVLEEKRGPILQFLTDSLVEEKAALCRAVRLLRRLSDDILLSSMLSHRLELSSWRQTIPQMTDLDIWVGDSARLVLRVWFFTTMLVLLDRSHFL